MTFGALAFLFAAAMLAGAVNAVAGGGSLLSFPAAMAVGIPSIMANATNSTALVPGSIAAAWTYRRSLAGVGRLTFWLSVPAVAGALIGAAILRNTPQSVFNGIVPWLVLGATSAILFQGPLRARTSAPLTSSGAPAGDGTAGRRLLPVAMACQLLVSIYGGYFGAAMGIIMLAYLGMVARSGLGAAYGLRDIHQMNAVKNVLAVVINGVASIDFIAHGLVQPRAALTMAAGGIVGGVVGARLARRAPPRHVRRAIIAIGLGMTALLAWRHYGP